MNRCTKLLLLSAAALGGMAYANHRVAGAFRPLYSDVDGRPGIYPWREGIVYYHAKGEGQPVVLLHDLSLLGGSHQMRPAYDALAREYRVYAVDWLGYGQSTRPAADYTADQYEALLGDFLAEVVGEPAVVVAAGTSAAYAVRVAHARPELVSHLVLVCPTGVERAIAAPTAAQSLLRRVLRLPIVGPFIFNVLTSRPALKWHLRGRVFFDAGPVTPDLVEYMWVATHQPGARWAPISHWAGLTNRSIAYELSALKQPVMVAWGQQARQTPVEEIQGFKWYRPDARFRAFDRSGQWPQHEAARAFSALVRNWLQGKDKGAAAVFPGEVEPED